MISISTVLRYCIDIDFILSTVVILRHFTNKSPYYTSIPIILIISYWYWSPLTATHAIENFAYLSFVSLYINDAVTIWFLLNTIIKLFSGIDLVYPLCRKQLGYCFKSVTGLLNAKCKRSYCHLLSISSILTALQKCVDVSPILAIFLKHNKMRQSKGIFFRKYFNILLNNLLWNLTNVLKIIKITP